MNTRIIKKLNDIRNWFDSYEYLRLLSKHSDFSFKAGDLSIEIRDPGETLPYLITKSLSGIPLFIIQSKNGIDGIEYWLKLNIGMMTIPMSQDVLIEPETVLYLLDSFGVLNEVASYGIISPYVDDEYEFSLLVYNVRIPSWRLWNKLFFAELFEKVVLESANHLRTTHNKTTEEFKDSLSIRAELKNDSLEDLFNGIDFDDLDDNSDDDASSKKK